MSSAETDRRSHYEVLAGLVELAGWRVIDVGCGSGASVQWLRSQGADVVGVECGTTSRVAR